MKLEDTIGNIDWLRSNEKAIKNAMPETWTHVNNLCALHIGFSMKLLGIDWRNTDELASIMVFSEKIGMMLRDGYTIKRNPRSIFK